MSEDDWMRLESLVRRVVGEVVKAEIELFMVSPLERLEVRRVSDRVIADFLYQKCDNDESARTQSSRLHDLFCEWCKKAGYTGCMSNKVFSKLIENAGYVKKKFPQGNYFLGIRIKGHLDEGWY